MQERQAAAAGPITSRRDFPWREPWFGAQSGLRRGVTRCDADEGRHDEKMNKRPVTDTYANLAPGSLNDCRASFQVGPHSMANFRSDHAAGAHFLYGDGATRFLSENVDMDLYRRLSTIAGGEVARIP
jgi:hypothetical protein